MEASELGARPRKRGDIARRCAEEGCFGKTHPVRNLAAWRDIAHRAGGCAINFLSARRALVSRILRRKASRQYRLGNAPGGDKTGFLPKRFRSWDISQHWWWAGSSIQSVSANPALQTSCLLSSRKIAFSAGDSGWVSRDPLTGRFLPIWSAYLCTQRARSSASRDGAL